MATTIQDNVNNYYFKNQADFEAHKAEIPNNSTIYIEETGEVNVTINGTETENTEDLNNIVVGDKTYKVTGGGTSISTNSLNVTQEVLWTNSNPSQSFIEQDVNINGNLSDYDLLLFTQKISTSDTNYFTGFTDTENFKTLGKLIVHSEFSNKWGRDYNYVNETTIHISTGKYNSDSNNSYGIPINIIGFKFLNTLNYSTEEQYTGKYWIDGKKIYEKTIILENLSTGKTNIELTGVDTLVAKQSTFKRKDGSQYATNIQTNLSSGWSIYFNDFINGKLELIVGTNFSGNYQIIKAFITVQYTKTTE